MARGTFPPSVSSPTDALLWVSCKEKKVVLHDHSTAVASWTLPLTDGCSLISRPLSSSPSCSSHVLQSEATRPLSRVVSSRPASYALFLREKCPRLSLTFTALMLPKTASGVPGDVALDFGRSGGAFGDMQNLVGAALRSSRGAPAGAGRLRFAPPPVTLTSIPRRRGRLPADSTLK